MASEAVLQQSEKSDSPSAVTSNAAGFTMSTGLKSDTYTEKSSRNSSSCDEDGFGDLVIDTDEDIDKVCKEKPFRNYFGEKKSPVRNNNNNNSTARNLADNKHTSSMEKDNNANKSLYNSGNKLSSFSQNSANFQSNKISKTKSKKSGKPNKSNTPTSAANSTSIGSSSRASSPGASFIGTLDAESNHSHNFESRGLLPRTSGSPEDSIGKKSKSNKSKSHHKKHSKHSEKGALNNSSTKADITIEKPKSKSKSSTNSPVISSSVSSNTSRFCLPTVPHDLAARASTIASSVNAPEKLISNGQFQNIGQKFNDFSVSHSTSNAQKSNTSSPQGRLPAPTALVSNTTGSGAKSTHAYSQREHSESDWSASHNQYSRKKHRKNPPLANSSHSRISNFQGSSSISGKRERTSISSTLQTTSVNDSSKSKRIKLDTDAKSNPPRTTISSTPLMQIAAGTGENKASAQDCNRLTTRSKNADNSAGNFGQDSGVKNSGPLVFAPSSHFATNLPRFNVVNPSDTCASSVLSKEAAQQTNTGNQTLQDGIPANQSGNLRSIGTVTSTSDIGVMTEPDALGPCEPGTSVHLHGIVWHETDTGVLVVNVTWRNRTYVGTLLDATKHDWAPPRFSDNELDMELRGKSNRPKRSRAAQNEGSRKGRGRGANFSAVDDVKNSPSAAAKRRNKNSESDATNVDNDSPSTPKSSAKRLRAATPRGCKDANQLLQNEEIKTESNAGSESSSCSSPVFIECPHPKCSKRYKYPSGLKYHQVHAHGDANDEDQKETNDEETMTDLPSSSPEETIPEFIPSDVELPGIDDVTESRTPVNHDRRKTPVNHSSTVEFSAKDSRNNTEEKLKDIKNINQVGKRESNSEFLQSLPEKIPPSSSGFPSKQLQSSLSNHRDEYRPPINCTISVLPSPVKFPSDPKISFSSGASTISYSCITSAGTTDSIRNSLHHPPAHQQLTSDAADIESAQAVKTLLQLQDTDDSILPGLSSSYSQDSPHPTLSLGARTLPISNHEHSVVPRSFPLQLSSSTLSDAKSNLLSVSTYQLLSATSTDSSNVISAPVLVRSPTNASTVITASVSTLTSTDDKLTAELKEHLQDFSSRYSNASLTPSYTVSITSTTHSSGMKIAKGKTVPIPIDPNHSLQSTYAGSAAQSPFSNSAKKLKRKKKLEEKYSESPERHQYGIEPGPFQTSPDIGHSCSVGEVLNLGSTVPISVFPKSQAGITQETEPPPPTGHFLDSSRRLHSQHPTGANRKFPGIISPVSSSQSNNITVTGTFHPHPDPHKPQTAVSAQAQDRIRSNRPLSPSPSYSSSRTANRISVRSQHQSMLRSRPSSAHGDRGNIEKSLYQDQESLSRYKGSDIKYQSVEQPTIDRMQNQVDSPMENVFSKELTNRGKAVVASNPANVTADSPVAIQKDPSTEKSPVVLNDDVKKTPQKLIPKTNDPPRTAFDESLEDRKSTPSPRTRMLADQRARVPYFIGQQMLSLGLGYISPHLMDTAALHQLQYYPDPQLREKYERHLQALSQQQQQVERHHHANINEKESALRNSSPDKEDQAWQRRQLQPQQHSKNSSLPSPVTPHHHALGKEKLPGHNPLPSVTPTLGSSSSYRPPQPNLHHSAPTPRCHSVAPSNPPVDSSRSHHVRSESLDRGRVTLREDGKNHKNSPPPSIKIEKSPEKVKEKNQPQSAISNTDPVSYYRYIMDRTSYQGVPHYPSFPHGPAYMFPGPHPILHPQAGWISGSQQVPIPGKLSPPMKLSKERLSPAYRTSAKEDVKPKEFSSQYSSKEGRSRENADSMIDRKPVISPDAKPVQTSPALPRKSVTGSSVSSEIPTQMHHHTHHHIHDVGSVVFPTRYYPGSVMGGPDNVPPYSVPYQKRE